MKKVLFFLVAVGMTAIATSCEKDKAQTLSNETNQQLSSAPYAIVENGADYLVLANKSDNYFSGNFFGYASNKITISENVRNELSNLEMVDNLEFEGSGIIKMLKFSNFKSISAEKFSVDVAINNSVETITISSNTYTVDDFKNEVHLLLASSNKTQAWWVVPVIGAIYEAVVTISNNCTLIVQQGIASCQTGCYEASFCSVHCYQCN